MRKPNLLVLSGLVLTSVKLALVLLQTTPRTSSLSDLSDFGLATVLSVAAWKASRRSSAYARILWRGVALASLLWAISFGVGVFADLLSAPGTELRAFWPITLIFYVVGIAFLVPLLLNEDGDEPAISWLQTLDIAQLAILTLSAYLAFFYIPSITGHSDALRLRNFMIVHLTRDGFLLLGFLYRGWRSRSPDLRQLHFRLSAFFFALGVTASLYLRALSQWHWRSPFVGFVAGLPVLFLLLTAARWRQRQAAPRLPQGQRHQQGMLWRQVLPLVVPLSVIALASRISATNPRLGWAAITASFVCYAARLLVMQRIQDAALSSLSLMEEKFSKAFQSSPVAIAITRLSDGTYLEANDRYLEFMKMSREELIGRTSLELGVLGDVVERNRLVDILRKQGSFRSMPFRFRMADRTFDTLVSAELIQLEDESLILSSVLDVTELKNVTQQLQQAQKMELVGSLAGGVAHDFNNLLTIIKGYSELACMRELTGGQLAEDIRQIGQAADRAARLTRQLLAFSRRQILQPRNIELNAVVGGIEKMLQRILGENIEMTTSLAPDLGTVRADPGQIEQVIMNLAINSRDAMPRGGKLILLTKNVELTSPHKEREFEIPAGRYVTLAATDTGMGIAPEHLERVFEPFFTTKEAGQGTGLGLSTVYGIIKQSGGYISVHSKVNLGTTFEIYLPRVEQPAETLAVAGMGAQSLEGTETILVVEDDQRVCELTASTLRRLGYKIITANSGEDALRRATEFEGVIDLVITDVVMPRMNGPELADRLRKRRSDLKVLYMSGYSQLSSSDMSVVDFRQSLLTKPFTPSELAREARKALGRENYAARTEHR